MTRADRLRGVVLSAVILAGAFASTGAWASEEAVQGLADQLIDNIEAFWDGAPRNVVR